MPIEFDCPTCRTRIRTPDEAAGKKARCPQCGNVSAIPFSSQVDNPFASQGTLPSAGSFGTADTPFSPPAGAPGSPFASQVPPKPANPFHDPLTSGTTAPAFGANPNPYASPSMGGYQSQGPLTRDDVRRKLLGPAIGMTTGAVFCLGYMCLAFMAMFFGDDFARNAPDDGAERVGYFFGMAIAMFAFCVPGLLMLLGAVAMFRGQGKLAAWAGAIASVLPCSPCCFIGIGFGIWGMVVLSDARVSQVLSSTN